MSFVGLDLSLTGSGVVVIGDNLEVLHADTVKSKPSGKTPADEVRRLVTIRDSILAKVPDDVELVGIEGLAFMVRNATALTQLSGLNYLLREFFVRMGVPFVIVAPSSLKKFACGRGNADKDMIMLEVYKRWGFSADNNNTSDAFVLAKMASHMVQGDSGCTKEQKECLELLKPQFSGPSRSISPKK